MLFSDTGIQNTHYHHCKLNFKFHHGHDEDDDDDDDDDNDDVGGDVGGIDDVNDDGRRTVTFLNMCNF